MWPRVTISPNVTLVGVVSVDAVLLADFRAAERTFQLITQVAGRAGRGDRAGQVLVQTYHPEHYALRHACAQDYEGFYKEEIRHRQNHAYPPFVALASLLVHGTDQSRVRSEAVGLRKELDLANKDRSCRILGPAPAPLARLKGEHVCNTGEVSEQAPSASGCRHQALIDSRAGGSPCAG